MSLLIGILEILLFEIQRMYYKIWWWKKLVVLLVQSFIKSDFLTSLQFPEGKNYEDRLVMYEWVALCKKVVWVDSPFLSLCRTTNEYMSHDVSYESLSLFFGRICPHEVHGEILSIWRRRSFLKLGLGWLGLVLQYLRRYFWRWIWENSKNLLRIWGRKWKR